MDSVRLAGVPAESVEVVVMVVEFTPPSVIAVETPPPDELMRLLEGRRTVEVDTPGTVVAVTTPLDERPLLMVPGMREEDEEEVRSIKIGEAPTVVAVTALSRERLLVVGRLEEGSEEELDRFFEVMVKNSQGLSMFESCSFFERF